jgi:hypothetical protein
MKILHVTGNGCRMNTLEKYHLYKVTKQDIQLNDTLIT